MWLLEQTPEGAPALRCWPWSFAAGYGATRFGVECVLPITDPRPAPASTDWLEWSIAALRRSGKELPEPSQVLLREALNPSGVTRPDGLPAYRPSGPSAAEAQAARGTLSPGAIDDADDYEYGRGRMILRECSSYDERQLELGNGSMALFRATKWTRHTGSIFGRGDQRHGAPLRRVLAAVAFDLLDQPAHEVGAQLLGMNPLRAEHFETDSRAWRPAARYWAEGRRCSPSSAAGPGPTPRMDAGCFPAGGRWRSDQTYTEPLRRWLADCEVLTQALTRE